MYFDHQSEETQNESSKHIYYRIGAGVLISEKNALLWGLSRLFVAFVLRLLFAHQKCTVMIYINATVMPA